ncbi:hypothetical protein CGMCC3_g3082 [Colletotrichum fructicola]|nr:uncharacterized protein CGMCC3_g3082 [Colletotrichum fructicola]KAE9580959.1 hypothetical protein CGMCC3_g3082 [Colletotrichum fructicola]
MLAWVLVLAVVLTTLHLVRPILLSLDDDFVPKWRNAPAPSYYLD